MLFSACDIDLFHVKFWSIFDDIIRVVMSISKLPKKKSNSFSDLKEWISKDGNAKKIGTDLAKVLLSWEIFDNLREVRNSIVHKGGVTQVFLVKDKILFQVHETREEGLIRKILVPEVMARKNAVDFELYAGLYIGYLIAYLEEFSEIVYRRLNLDKVCIDFNLAYKKSSGKPHPELKVVKDWIEQVLLL